MRPAARSLIAIIAGAALAIIASSDAGADSGSTTGDPPRYVVVQPTPGQGRCDAPVPLERPTLKSAHGGASFRGLGGSPAFSTSVAVATSADGSVIVGDSRDRTSARDRGTIWRRDSRATLPYPDLPGDDTQWVAGVSGDGKVAVGTVTATTVSSVAALWRGCELVVLGGFPGGLSADARDASADGRRVVGFGLVAADECGRSSCYGSFLWRDGEMTRLSDEHGAPLIGQAKSISADGRVIVGWGTARNEAFRIEDGRLRWLGFAANASDSRAEAVSPDGSVVVGTSGEVAFRATQLGLERLATLPDLPRSYAHDVSRYGCRIVGNTLPPPPPRDERPPECRDPDYWRNATAQSRKHCQAIGPSKPRPPTTAQVFLWEQGHGTRLLSDILRTEHGIDVGAWLLDEAFAISADGTTIVGDGKNPEGMQEAWVVRLPPPVDCQR